MSDEELFSAALRIQTSADRLKYLDDVCAGNPDQRARVAVLLAALDDAGSFLNKPVAELPPVGPTMSPGVTNGGQPGMSGSGEVRLDFLSPSTDPNVLGQLGPYVVEEVIGRGGMGVVLRAIDPKLNRVVAIKVLAPEYLANPVAVKRFLREAQAAAAVTHDHVVRIYAVDDTARVPYLVMECIVGQSLQQKIERRGILDVREILRIGHQIAAGLAAAHKQGLVHRDIKPANILLENGIERVKITDFGLARAVDDVGMTQSGQVTGTPQYMSPEQAMGEQVDHRSDLFSLGSVLYTMCTGRPAFRATSTVAVLRRVVDDMPRPILEVNPDCPQWLVVIVDRLMSKRPEDRFQTAGEVATVLEQWLAHAQRPQIIAPPAHVAAVQNASTMVADRRGVIRRAWDEWWSERDRWFTIAVQSVLVVLHLFCMIMFLGMTSSREHQGYDTKFKYTLGAISPWYKFEINQDGNHGFTSGFFPFTSSVLIGLVGCALYYVVWRIEKARDPNTSGWNKPQVLLSLWGIMAIAGVCVGMAQGFAVIASGTKALGGSGTDAKISAKAQPARPDGPQRPNPYTTFLDGRWMVVRQESGGAQLPSHLRAKRWDIAGQKRRETPAQDVAETVCEIVVDSTQKPPHIDLISDGKTFQHGIYELRGDELTVCFSTPPEPRPTSFVTRRNTTAQLTKLNRTNAGGETVIARFDNPDLKPLIPAWANQANQPVFQDGAWRIENDANAGNFNVLMGTQLENIPSDGFIVCRALIKVQVPNKNTSGNLRLGDYEPGTYDYHWPASKYSYIGDIPEWTLKEIRYPAKAFHQLKPPQIPIYVSLHNNGVLWVRDLELLHLMENQSDGRTNDTAKSGPETPAKVTSPKPNVVKVDAAWKARMADIARDWEMQILPPRRAVAPFSETEALQVQEAWSSFMGQPSEFTNSIGMKLRLVPPGEFQMGCTAEQAELILSKTEFVGARGWVQAATPQHREVVDRPYYIGCYEVTYDDFSRFTLDTQYKTEVEVNGQGGTALDRVSKQLVTRPDSTWRNPEFTRHGNEPVKLLTTNDMRAFCKWLSDREGRRYSLVSDIEWEFACRAGTTTIWSSGDDVTKAGEYGVYNKEPLAVGTRKPNAFGLFDMLGNMFEVTENLAGTFCQRGGSGQYDPWVGQCAGGGESSKGNFGGTDDLGFRIMCEVVKEKSYFVPPRPTSDPAEIDIVSQEYSMRLDAALKRAEKARALHDAKQVTLLEVLTADSKVKQVELDGRSKSGSDWSTTIPIARDLVRILEDRAKIGHKLLESNSTTVDSLEEVETELSDARIRLAELQSSKLTQLRSAAQEAKRGMENVADQLELPTGLDEELRQELDISISTFAWQALELRVAAEEGNPKHALQVFNDRVRASAERLERIRKHEAGKPEEAQKVNAAQTLWNEARLQLAEFEGNHQAAIDPAEYLIKLAKEKVAVVRQQVEAKQATTISLGKAERDVEQLKQRLDALGPQSPE